nr:6-phosphogluconolactonase [uncultured Cohaesibacter sp.]
MLGANIKEHQFDTSLDAASALAATVAANLKQALAEKDNAILAVSGGRTPELLFKALSEIDLAWEKVTVTLVDERFVPDSSERSNARLVKSALLQNKARGAKLVPLYQDGVEAEDVARNPSSDLQFILDKGFDAVVLGMGPDGHTASFFPGGDNLEEATNPENPPAIFAMHAEGAGEPRLTFSASALLITRSLFLQLEGQEKQAVFQKAIQAGSVLDMPIRVFIHQAHKCLEVFKC